MALDTSHDLEEVQTMHKIIFPGMQLISCLTNTISRKTTPKPLHHNISNNIYNGLIHESRYYRESFVRAAVFISSFFPVVTLNEKLKAN